eukprot:2604133-Rhodomonas_salina.4
MHARLAQTAEHSTPHPLFTPARHHHHHTDTDKDKDNQARCACSAERVQCSGARREPLLQRLDLLDHLQSPCPQNTPASAPDPLPRLRCSQARGTPSEFPTLVRQLQAGASSRRPTEQRTRGNGGGQTWVGALEFAPAVDVHRVLQLLGEGLDLGALGEELALEVVDLVAEHVDVGGLLLEHVQLALQVVDLELQHPDVFQPLAVLHLALVQRRLLDLDLLVQQRELVVAPNQLRAEDVALVDHLQRIPWGGLVRRWTPPREQSALARSREAVWDRG